jgi:hypothetical protein
MTSVSPRERPSLAKVAGSELFRAGGQTKLVETMGLFAANHEKLVANQEKVVTQIKVGFSEMGSQLDGVLSAMQLVGRSVADLRAVALEGFGSLKADSAATAHALAALHADFSAGADRLDRGLATLQGSAEVGREAEAEALRATLQAELATLARALVEEHRSGRAADQAELLTRLGQLQVELSSQVSALGSGQREKLEGATREVVGLLRAIEVKVGEGLLGVKADLASLQVELKRHASKGTAALAKQLESGLAKCDAVAAMRAAALSQSLAEWRSHCAVPSDAQALSPADAEALVRSVTLAMSGSLREASAELKEVQGQGFAAVAEQVSQSGAVLDYQLRTGLVSVEGAVGAVSAVVANLSEDVNKGFGGLFERLGELKALSERGFEGLREKLE